MVCPNGLWLGDVFGRVVWRKLAWYKHGSFVVVWVQEWMRFLTKEMRVKKDEGVSGMQTNLGVCEMR